MFGTMTAHIDIEKLNERGKKRLNAKYATWQDLIHSHMRSLLLYILAFNPRNMREYCTYLKYHQLDITIQ